MQLNLRLVGEDNHIKFLLFFSVLLFLEQVTFVNINPYHLAVLTAMIFKINSIKIATKKFQKSM